MLARQSSLLARNVYSRDKCDFLTIVCIGCNLPFICLAVFTSDENIVTFLCLLCIFFNFVSQLFAKSLLLLWLVYEFSFLFHSVSFLLRKSCYFFFFTFLNNTLDSESLELISCLPDTYSWSAPLSSCSDSL